MIPLTNHDSQGSVAVRSLLSLANDIASGAWVHHPWLAHLLTIAPLRRSVFWGPRGPWDVGQLVGNPVTRYQPICWDIFYIKLNYIISYHIILYHVILYYIKLYYIRLYLYIIYYIWYIIYYILYMIYYYILYIIYYILYIIYYILLYYYIILYYVILY